MKTEVLVFLTRHKHTEEFPGTNKATTSIWGIEDSLEGGQMSNCSECSISCKDISTCQSSLRCHFANLTKQMAQQRAEYEAIILSLEQQNKDLESEVKDLHSKLDQQRKWHHLVEIKICNAERAHKDAERRNEALQREMEEFFGTFGEVTSEEKMPEQITQSF